MQFTTTSKKRKNPNRYKRNPVVNMERESESELSDSYASDSEEEYSNQQNLKIQKVPKLNLSASISTREEPKISKPVFKLDLSFLPTEDSVLSPPDSSRSSSERSDPRRLTTIPKLNLSDISLQSDSSPRTPTSLSSPDRRPKQGIPSLNLGSIGKLNSEEDVNKSKNPFRIPFVPPLALAKGKLSTNSLIYKIQEEPKQNDNNNITNSNNTNNNNSTIEGRHRSQSLVSPVRNFSSTIKLTGLSTTSRPKLSIPSEHTDPNQLISPRRSPMAKLGLGRKQFYLISFFNIF